MTEITIELTDDDVHYLRHLPVGDWNNVLGKAKAALPPEPIKLEIELPAESPIPAWRYAIGDHITLASGEARVLNAVRDALQARADR